MAANVARRSPSMQDMLQDSSSSAVVLVAAALWVMLRKVLHAIHVMLIETLRAAQLISLPLLSVAQTRRSVSPRPHRLSGGMMAPQQWLHQPDVWQLQQQPSQAAAGVDTMHMPGAQTAGTQHRFTVVLDLDETLVWTATRSHAAEDDAATNAVAAAGSFVVHAELSAGVFGKLTVMPRPGLFDFLSRASRVAQLVVFTAAAPGYAQPILDVLDPAGKLFSARLYRDSTTATMHHSNVKDLSRLGCDLAHTVLVDDSPLSFLLQPSNGLPIRPFTGRSSDHDLLTVVLPIVEGLARCGSDIRPLLDKEFRMRAWLQRRLSPS